MQTLSAELLWKFYACSNDFLSLIRFFKVKYYGTFIYTAQHGHANSYLNLKKGIFIDISLMIAEIKKNQYAEILNSPEMWLRDVSNFSHVCTLCVTKMLDQQICRWTDFVLVISLHPSI